MLHDLFAVILVTSWILLGLVCIKVFFFVGFSTRHHRTLKRLHPKELSQNPLVSILVPSYNESKTLKNCINSLLKQSYDNTEIVIIDDGSTDDTLEIARALAKEHKKIRTFSKKNGGKSTALNMGISKAKGSIVVCIDADSMFVKNTVEQLVLSFHDPDVAAVGGNVKVANRHGLLGRQQALEYITGLTLHRRTFAHLGCMQVISGAIGAFRKDIVEAVGGYSSDTIVEDMDITIELVKRGYKVVYNPLAVAYTEAPQGLRNFMRQRYRWTFGGLEVLSKHRSIIGSRQNKWLGLLGMPYFLVFPWLDVLVSFLLMLTLVRVFVTGDYLGLLPIYAVMSAMQISLAIYALVVDKEDKKLGLLIALDSLYYYHLLTFTTLRAGFNFARKKKTSWNKLERYGKNIVHTKGEEAETPAVAA